MDFGDYVATGNLPQSNLYFKTSEIRLVLKE